MLGSKSPRCVQVAHAATIVVVKKPSFVFSESPRFMKFAKVDLICFFSS